MARIDKEIKKKRGQEMKVQTMIMMHEGCNMNEKMKLKQKTKQNATKYKVKMTCQDEETKYRPMHDKGSKGVCKRWLCAMHGQCIENEHVGQDVLNTQSMNQTCS